MLLFLIFINFYYNLYILRLINIKNIIKSVIFKRYELIFIHKLTTYIYSFYPIIYTASYIELYNV